MALSKRHFGLKVLPASAGAPPASGRGEQLDHFRAHGGAVEVPVVAGI